MPPPKTPRRLIAGFFLRLVLAYAALMSAWPILKAPYAAYHRALGNLCFASFGSHAAVHFEPAAGNDPVRDTLIHIRDRQISAVEIALPISARYTAYMPTAFTICLILATPLPARRRLAALLIGLVLVHLFILAWLALSLLDEMSNPAAPLRIFALTGVDKSILRFIVTNVVESVIATAYVAPIFIWIVSAFRRRDREWLISGFVPQIAEATPIDPRSQPRP